MGISRARKQGKRLGRPTVVIDREKGVPVSRRREVDQGHCQENGIARSTVRSILGRPKVAEIPQ
jgi:hypothetical protein